MLGATKHSITKVCNRTPRMMLALFQLSYHFSYFLKFSWFLTWREFIDLSRD